MSTLHDAERLEIDETDEIGAGEGPLTLVAPPAAAGQRLDKALALLLPEISRSRLQQWIDDGAVRVDGGAARVRQLLSGGERIDIVAPPSPAQLAMRPEPIELEVVYEDAHIAVLDKPPGLVVHPAAGNWSGTLANGLLARFPQTAGLPRAGIVHRLDADTSGLMVVALSLQAQTDLVRQLQARSVMREYWAIVAGVVPPAMTALLESPGNRVQAFLAAGHVCAVMGWTEYEPLAEKYQVIGDVRGLGLMIGIEFVKDRAGKEPNGEVVDALVQRAFEHGLLLLGAGPSALRLAPPLVIDEQDVDTGLRILDECLAAVA